MFSRRSVTLTLALSYRFLCIKIIDCNVKMFVYNEIHLQGAKMVFLLSLK